MKQREAEISQKKAPTPPPSKPKAITVEHSTNTDFEVPEVITKEKTVIIDNNAQMEEIEKLWKEKFEMQERQHSHFIDDQQRLHLKQRELLEVQLAGEREKQDSLEKELSDLRIQQEQQILAFEKERQEQLHSQEAQHQKMQEQLLMIKLEQEKQVTHETHIMQEQFIIDQKKQIDDIKNLWREKFEIQQQQQLKFSEEQQELHLKQQQLLADQLDEERDKQRSLELELTQMKATQDQQLIIFEQQREQQIQIQEMQQSQMQEQIRLLQQQQEDERLRMLEEQKIQKELLEKELEHKLVLQTKEKEIITQQQITQQQLIQESLLEEHRRQMEEMERNWRERFEQQRIEQERLTKDQQLTYERQKQLLEQQLEEERRKQLTVEEQLKQMKLIQEQQHSDFERQRIEQNRTREMQQIQLKEQFRLLQEQKEHERIQMLKEQLQQQDDLKEQLKRELNEQQLEKEVVMQQQIEQQRLLQEQYEKQKLLQEQMVENQKRRAEEAEREWKMKMDLQLKQRQEQERQIELKKSEIKEIRARQMAPSINGNAPYNFVQEEDATRKLVLSSLERKAHIHNQINYDSSSTTQINRSQITSASTYSPPTIQQSLTEKSPIPTGFYTPPPPATDIVPEISFRPPMSFSKQEEEVVVTNDVINESELHSSQSSSEIEFELKAGDEIQTSDSGSQSPVTMDPIKPTTPTPPLPELVVPVPPPPPVVTQTEVTKVTKSKITNLSSDSFKTAIKKSAEARQTAQAKKVVEQNSMIAQAAVLEIEKDQKQTISEALHDRFREAVHGYRKDYAEMTSSSSSINKERPKSELPEQKPVVGDPDIKLDEDEAEEEQTVSPYTPEDDGWEDGVTRVIHVHDKYIHVLLRIRVERGKDMNAPTLHTLNDFLFKAAKFTLHQFKKQKVEKV